MTIFTNILRGGIKKLRRIFENPYQKVGLNWIQVRRLKNLPTNKPNTTPFFNHTVKYIHHNEFLHSIEEIFFKEIYKTDFQSNNAPYILDCGANIGLSVIYFKHLYPNAEIVAFEPDISNLAVLQANIEKMQLKQVTIKPEAVWNENKMLQFSSAGTQSSKIESSSLKPSSAGIIEVRAIRLKDFLTKKVDLLKLDIEGAEYEVILDIEDKMPLIERIFLEYHGSFFDGKKLEAMLSILTRNGFKYYITEANQVYSTPFYRPTPSKDYDVQLNISCFKD